MENKPRKIMKTGSDFRQFPAMRVAKIYESDPPKVPLTKRQPSNPEIVYKQLVQIALPKLNTHFIKSISIPDQVDHIVDIDWSLKLQNHALDIPSAYFILSGILVGDLDYESRKDRKTYSIKLSLPWKVNSMLSYTYPPLDTKPLLKESHLFNTDNENVIHHQTQYIHPSDETLCELVRAEITSAEDVEDTKDETTVQLLVDVDIYVRLLQNQMHEI